MDLSSIVGKDKAVIGKPGTASDASNGFMEADMLATCVAEAKGKGWNAGYVFIHSFSDTVLDRASEV